MYIVSMQQCSVGRCCVPYHTLYWNVLQDTISGVVVMMNGSRYQTPCYGEWEGLVDKEICR